MKINHVFTVLSLVCILSLAPATLAAQDSKKSPKVNKELKQVMKELPTDIQLQVLRYAERQKEAYHAAKIKREELDLSPKQMIKPQTAAKPAKTEKKAAPAPQKAIELKPSGTSNSSFSSAPVDATPPTPSKPEYMRIAETMAPTSIEWAEESFDFGEVKEGTKPSHIYRFKNTGANPLKITRVKPSCGCTTPSWSKEEIAPGEEGFIEVSYNSKNRPGVAHKSITVTGNFEQYNKVLRFKVNVIRTE